MVDIQAAFSGFSVHDLAAAKQFYSEVLGCAVDDTMGGTTLKLPTGLTVWVYPKHDHQPAGYTMLNFVVTDITTAVDTLLANGVTMLQYEGFNQDEKGIAWGKKVQMGPNIAWFNDPAGNILAVLED